MIRATLVAFASLVFFAGCLNLSTAMTGNGDDRAFVALVQFCVAFSVAMTAGVIHVLTKGKK